MKAEGKLKTEIFWSEETVNQHDSITLLDDLPGASDETRPSGGNQTNLLTTGLVSSDSRWVTNVLVVTTTVRMLDWVHGNTSDSGPVVSLGLVLVPGGVGSEEWLVGSLTTSSNSNHGSAVTLDGLSGAGWEFDSGLPAVLGVADDDGGGTGSSSERASVTVLSLAVGDDGSLWHLVDWKNVAD